MRALVLAALVLLPLFTSGHAGAQSVPDNQVTPRATLSVAVNDPGHTMKPGKNESIEIIFTYGTTPGGFGKPAPDPNNPDPTTGVEKTRITFAAKKLPTWVLNVTF